MTRNIFLTVLNGAALPVWSASWSAPLVILAVVFKIMPPLNAILAAATIRISACLVYYFIEPISFQPVLGIPGTYMAFLSGNLSNLRVPCSSVAQKAAGV